MKYFFVWLANQTDRQDDEVLKVRAKTKLQARRIAEEECDDYRFYIADVYTAQQFKKWDPWWHALLWGKPAVNEPKKKKRRN